MELVTVRPRFTFDAPGGADELIALVCEAFERPDSRCVCRVVGRHLDITVVREDRHRWSPCLSLELDEQSDHVHVRGLIGPHPNVWTFFVFAYSSFGLLMLFAAIYAYAQHSLGQPPWAVYAAIACVALLAMTYAASMIGRRLASEQTHFLIGELESHLGVTLKR